MKFRIVGIKPHGSESHAYYYVQQERKSLLYFFNKKMVWDTAKSSRIKFMYFSIESAEEDIDRVKNPEKYMRYDEVVKVID
jgi:hypothetical protein